MASNVAPVFLRVALGVTFLWAGIGKFAADMTINRQQAVVLASYGSIAPAAAPTKPADAAPAETNTPETKAPETKPADTKAPEAKPPAAQSSDTKPAEAAPPPASKGPVSSIAGTLLLAQTTSAQTTPAAPSTPVISRAQPSAADFPETMSVSRVHGLTLLLHSAANPAPGDNGQPKMALWPAFASKDHWPKTLAYAAAITEITAGLFLLVGLFVRVSAFSLAGVMLGAIWLTEIGPAMQAGTARFGILPGYGLWDVGAWKTILWQLSLLCSALALVFTGPGALALDNALFPAAPSKPASSNSPKPANPRPAGV
jgi:uncharacterized membrane protein YphA (DoxX/SURF4 family)